MSGLDDLDRPVTPASPGAWDERSRACLASASASASALASAAAAAAAPLTSTNPHRDPYPDPDLNPDPTPESGGTDPGPAPAPDARLAPVGADRRTTLRRPGADPVKALIHRHRELCERAVDPLEIAAGLEAHGVTDRTASRFRHRDVFSLAEEMYARVPHDGDRPEPAPDPTGPATAAPADVPAPRPRAGWIALTLLPGALGTATVAGLHLTHGRPRLVIAAVGTLAVFLAVRALLGRGRPNDPAGHHPVLWILWLTAYAVLGDGLLTAALGGGPDGLPTGADDGPWPVTVAPALALTLACAPAAWCIRLFGVRAGRRLSASRGLEDFAASVRPLLFGSLAAFLCALSALLFLTGTVLDEPAAYAQALPLGALLLLARLLARHGSAHAPALVLTAAATVEATALAALFASRLPGCDALAAPVEALVAACGPGSVPTAACGAGALVLLLHAARRLTRASAHAHPEPRR
ncbi:hypothetical protein [Streptomyces sp. CRN 30]|uniref:hypothetical protein n=1 Tax=Streptomyces sp. CRN 30 TaxID=3075613 RepID=UPI002A82D0A3|nr:hypothetical protein [Streptomyces sp. CRN 30]